MCTVVGLVKEFCIISIRQLRDRLSVMLNDRDDVPLCVTDRHVNATKWHSRLLRMGKLGFHIIALTLMNPQAPPSDKQVAMLHLGQKHI